MEHHKGKILVESDLDTGSTFHLFFPVITLNETEEEIPESVNMMGSEHILVVEDEISLARFYEISLTQLGYQVTLAENGAEALEKIQAKPHEFDLIFSDQTMPKMSGIELCRAALIIRPDIPFILASGYGDPQSEDEAKALKITHYITKPIKITKLSQLIRETLNKFKKTNFKEG